MSIIELSTIGGGIKMMNRSSPFSLPIYICMRQGGDENQVASAESISQLYVQSKRPMTITPR